MKREGNFNCGYLTFSSRSAAQCCVPLTLLDIIPIPIAISQMQYNTLKRYPFQYVLVKYVQNSDLKSWKHTFFSKLYEASDGKVHDFPEKVSYQISTFLKVNYNDTNDTLN